MIDVQPSGTVALVFTDVEGSADCSRSWARMPTATRSESIGAWCGRRFGAHHGYEVD